MHTENQVSVLDVAAYILSKQPKADPISAWKLQKLVYYSQAWSLVWDDKPLFKEKILAWANGPVVKELYNQHRGSFYVTTLNMGDPENLSANQKDTINHVLDAYGHRPAQWLSDLTHMEKPWIDARKDLKIGERGNVEITLTSMQEYYTSLTPDKKLPS